MLSGFKQFILRGNVVDMAVGIVIGAAFGGMVTAFTKDVITPILAMFVSDAKVSGISFTAFGTKFPVGEFVNAVISFFIIAAVLYFLVVLPVNALVKRMHKAPAPADPTTKKCPECLSDIPIAAKRCAFCTQAVASSSPVAG